METKSKVLIGIAIASIILSAMVTSALHHVNAQTTTSKDGIIKFTNGIITVVIPANGTKPMFIWWYNNKNDTVYVFKYNGLAEIWLFGSVAFTHKLVNEEENVKDFIEKVLDNTTGVHIKDLLNEMIEHLHELEGLNLVNMNGSLNKENIQEFLSTIQNINSQINKLPNVFKDNLTSIISDIINQVLSLKNATDVYKAIKIVNQVESGIRNLIFSLNRILNETNNAINHVAAVIRHPFYFSFDSANWSFIGPKNITLSNGQVVGIQFTFKLSEVNDKRFRFAEGNISITNELFFTTVTYKSGNQTFKVTNAELKSNIIIKHWDWNLYDIQAKLVNNTSIEGYVFSTLKKIKPSLILISHFSNPVVQKNESEEFNELAKSGGEDEFENENSVVYTNQTKGFELGKPMLNDTEISSQKVYDEDEPTLIVKSSNATIAGFFRFVPYATVLYANGTNSIVSVKGYFILEGRHVSVFIQYPYFDNGTLMHDPTVGIAGANVSTQPSYIVSVSSNGEVTATQQGTVQQTSINIAYYIIAAVIAVAVIVAFVILIRRIKK